MTDLELSEYASRIMRLTDPPRLMSSRAATIVVDAAMFGIGCTEGKVREQIEYNKQMAARFDSFNPLNYK